MDNVPQPPLPNQPLPRRRPPWFLLLLLGPLLYWMLMRDAAPPESLAYSALKQAVEADQVATVTIAGQQLLGTFKDHPSKTGEARPFSTTLPPFEDATLMPLLERHHVTVQVRASQTPLWEQVLFGVLPWILLAGLVFMGSRQLRQGVLAGPEGPLSFGRSRARRFKKGAVNTTFADVAGLENAKRDLQEIIEYLRQPDRFQSLGARIPKGILLMGPPGTGKTLLAKAVAGEAEVPFFSISGSEFIEMFVGVGAARVRDMFQDAKKEAPAVLFIDEIDSVGRARGTGLGGGHDEREQTLNQILSEMDGFAAHETVVVLAATNRPDVLDPALLRPGRFDRKITLELPDRPARVRILQVHTRAMPLAPDVDLAKIAARTVGFSGADLENLANESALLAGRDHKTQVDMASLEKARDKIIMGAEREGLSSDEERRVVACHESGHALLASLLPDADPLDKVTIIPRGLSLGATEQTPEQDRHNLKKSYLVTRIAVLLGGRVAEQLTFGEVSSGSENDLEIATQIARRMVARFGMSEQIGAVAYRVGEEHVFLGREIAQARDFSEHTAQRIDEEVQRMIAEAETQALRVLGAHRGQLDKVAAALLEHETLSALEVQALMAEVPGEVQISEGVVHERWQGMAH